MAAQLMATKGPLRRGLACVDELGQQFLAGAAFGLYQDGGTAVGGPAGQDEGFRQDWILGEDHWGVRGLFGPEALLAADGLLDGLHQFVRAEWLGEVVEGSQAHGFPAVSRLRRR